MDANWKHETEIFLRRILVYIKMKQESATNDTWTGVKCATEVDTNEKI